MTNTDGRTKRIRLSEWAKGQGIAWVTAHRMIKNGILPVPCERSPTGRWYVWVTDPNHHNLLASYIQTLRGEGQHTSINAQTQRIAYWAREQRRHIAMTVREVVDPNTLQRPKLAQMLADARVSDIVVDNVDVIGRTMYPLLTAALHGQNRAIIIANTGKTRAGSARTEAGREILTLARANYDQRIVEQVETLITPR